MKNQVKSRQKGERELNLNRRKFLGYFSALGLGSTLLPGALACSALDGREITAEMLATAARIAGLEFSNEELESIAHGLNSDNNFVAQFEEMRRANLGNSTAPAVVFNPVPDGFSLSAEQQPVKYSAVSATLPDSDEELAFLPVTDLAKLIQKREITSIELTRLYLDRLKKYDPKLFCVVSLTEALALQQAEKADEEISNGQYRGPLHGIPYGLKDLFAVKGYRTTWGASPYRDQIIDVNSTVFERLTQAGAVLVAKLSSGALASGADWFGGTTRNPWNPALNSYGSSAGPAAATAAGLVAFAIGTETAGSIASPAAACGVTGFRPSFGRISRYGCMALSWTMDNVGSLCRSAEDCAVVAEVLFGNDGKDNSVIDVPFNWDGSTDLTGLRIGLWNTIVEHEDPVDEDHELTGARLQLSQRKDAEAVEVLKALGAEMVPFEMPEFNTDIFGILFSVESGAAFDDLMRSGRVDLMRNAPENSNYPDSLRRSRFIPGIEYLQANRVRSLMMQELHEAINGFDLLIGSDIYLTNLTGYPELSIPHGFYDEGLPTTFRLTGKLFGETEILKVAHAFQSKTDHHLKHPTL